MSVNRSLLLGRWLVIGAVAAPALLLIVYYSVGVGPILDDPVYQSITSSDVLESRSWNVALTFAVAAFLGSVVALVPAVFWCWRADRRGPVDDRGSRSTRGLWTACLVVALATGGAVGYWRFITSNSVAPGEAHLTIWVLSAALMTFAVIISYWLVTATFVRPAMRASVPLALRIFTR